MKKRVKLTILLFAIICLSYALQPWRVIPSVQGLNSDTIYSKYSPNTPTLNGVIGEDWENANVYVSVGDGNIFDVYLMHDEDFFYIGIRASDPSEEAGDIIKIFFEEGDDGEHGSGSSDYVLTNDQEDYKAIDGAGIRWDGFWSSPYWLIFPSTGDPDQINFEVAIDYHTNRWEAEFKIPFQGVEGQNDKSDLAINRDDVIGIVISIQYSDLTYDYYPSGANVSDATTWLNFTFDDEAPTVSNVTYTPSQPGPSEAVTVTVDVTDSESGINNVMLSYSINGGVTWTDVAMSNTTSYSGIIPKRAEDTTVQFKVTATDNAGFTTESEISSYTVKTLLFGIDPLIFYVIVGVLAVAIVGAVIFLIRSRKPGAPPLPPPTPLQPMPPPTTSAYCIECGTVLKPEAAFCPNCGKKVT